MVDAISARTQLLLPWMEIGLALPLAAPATARPGTTTIVSVDSGGFSTSGSKSAPSVSHDGRFMTFESSSNSR